MFKFAIAALLALSVYADTTETYGYKTNGDDWGTIHEGKWALCDTGKEQSPIDLKSNATVNDDIELVGYNYFDFNASNSDAATATSNLGKTMTMPSPANENASLELVLANGQKEKFTPLQFHFHAPSEHTVDGKFYDLEVHFVHAGENSTYSVVGVFFDTDVADESNPFIASVLEAFSTKDEAAADRKDAAVREFFNSVTFNEYWSYPGSFTTPPCTEGVRWNVVKDVQKISAAQLKEFTQYWADDQNFAEGKGSNRKTQPINQRTLYMSSAKAASNDDEDDDAATSLFAGAAATIAAIAALAF